MSRPVSVLFEDNHLLVLDKPALVATMGVDADRNSLINQAKDYLRHKYQKPGNVYLGVVSRLDSHVSGVVVFARTSKAAARLTQQFASRSVTKFYWAIVPGNSRIAPNADWCHFVYKDDHAKRMFALQKPDKSRDTQEARLRFRTLANDGKRRLLEIQLLTGRKHQIRTQFAFENAPIIGDRKYGSSIPFPHGIALHSRSLELEHPTTKALMKFDAFPPKYWNIEQFSL